MAFHSNKKIKEHPEEDLEFDSVANSDLSFSSSLFSEEWHAKPNVRLDDEMRDNANESLSNKRQSQNRHLDRSGHEKDRLVSWTGYLDNQWMTTLPSDFYDDKWMVIVAPRGHRCLLEHSTSQAATRIYDRLGTFKKTLSRCLFPFSHASHNGMRTLNMLMQELQTLLFEPSWFGHLGSFYGELKSTLETCSSVCRLDAIFVPQRNLYYITDVFSWTSYPSLLDCDSETRFALLQQSILQIQAIFDRLIRKLDPLSAALQAELERIFTTYFPFIPARPVPLSTLTVPILQSLSRLTDSCQSLRMSFSQHGNIWRQFFHSSSVSLEDVEMDGYLFYPRYESLSSSAHVLWLRHFMFNSFLDSFHVRS